MKKVIVMVVFFLFVWVGDWLVVWYVWIDLFGLGIYVVFYVVYVVEVVCGKVFGYVVVGYVVVVDEGKCGVFG